MGETTAISWTDHTFNPWWGCSKVPGSPACTNCYAEATAKMRGQRVWGVQSPRRLMSDAHWAGPVKWDTRAMLGDPVVPPVRGPRARPLVFCASMADVFEDVRLDVMVDAKGCAVDGRSIAGERDRLWELIAATPHLTWQLLTKRPENVGRMVPPAWMVEWPENVWLGVTVEDQDHADERIPELVKIPAPVRFLSMEPLFERVDLYPWLDGEECPDCAGSCSVPVHGGGRPCTTCWHRSGGPGPVGYLQPISWVIAGGESGPRHRPLELDAARFVRDQCDVAGVAFFFKQVGGLHPTSGGDQLDGRTHKTFPEAL